MLKFSKASNVCEQLVIPQWSSAVLKCARYHPSGFKSSGCGDELLSHTWYSLISNVEFRKLSFSLLFQDHVPTMYTKRHASEDASGVGNMLSPWK